MEYSDDDDDDDFYDRTAKKKTAAKKTEQKADTHESLLEKHKVLLGEMSKLETRIQQYDASAAERKRLEESGDLDAYMASLEKSGGDSKAKMQQTLAAMKKVGRRPAVESAISSSLLAYTHNIFSQIQSILSRM